MNAWETEKEQKFIKLYQSYVDEVYQFIYARSGFVAAIAEDITQDIFLDIFRGLDRFKGFCSERTWVYKIAKNKQNDFYRRQYRNKVETCEMNEAELLHDPAQDIDRRMEKSFESRFIRDCLDKLAPHYQMILLMKYADDKSIKQIAEITGKSLKATESALQRAKGAFIKGYQTLKESEES